MMSKPLRALVGALALLFAALGAQGATRAELEAKAAAVRQQISVTMAQADALIAQRGVLIERVAALQAEAAAIAAQIAALPPDHSDVLRYWYTSDDGDGPSRSHWSRHLKIGWVNFNGDFRDAAGTRQGTVPFAQVTHGALGPLSIALADVQALRKGILLRMDGKSAPYLSFGGRLSATPPTLTVKLQDGSERTLPVLSLAKWDTSTYTGADTRQSARLSAKTASVLALFDIPRDAVSGTLNLTVVARNSYTGTISVFALDPPGILYPHEHPPVLGLAAEVADEEALKTHPDVIRAGDFDLRKSKAEGGTFDGRAMSDNMPHEFLPDPLNPGRFIHRSGFKQRDGTYAGDQNGRGSLSLTIGTMGVDKSDPLLPLAGPPTKELFGRACFKLEADWLARNDANKMTLGWDLRFGYWAQGGYWQQTTGNGGARGTGLKLLRTDKSGKRQWEYQGHSIRTESGMAPKDPNHPHDALRPIVSYTYHLDQFDFNGTGERWGNAVIERGRWHCIEQQIRVNSIVGPYDAVGNGQAVPDGVLRTWLDGVYVGERTAMRWHRHPEMGIEGPWINWFFGGKQAADHEMHYQQADFVLARRYIGLPRNFAQRNAK